MENVSDVPVVPGYDPLGPSGHRTVLTQGPTQVNISESAPWRVTRLVLAWVAIVALVEVVIALTWALAVGVDVSNRLAHLNDPVPTATGCPFGEGQCGG